MTWLRVNWLRVAAYVVLAISVGWVALSIRAHFIGVGEDRVQAKWDSQKAADLRESLRLEQEASRQALLRFKNAERIADEQARRDAARESRIAQLGRRVSGLLSTIDALNGRPLPAPTDAAGVASLAREASTARGLLGRCGARYRDLAARAAELRDQVIGLQDDANSVCRAPALPKDEDGL